MRTYFNTDSNKKINFTLIGLIIFLALYYLSGMIFTGRFSSLNNFDSNLVMDTAQVARNTARGNLFATKYILPVSYTYFSSYINHPDFFRHPFQVLLYSFLFFILSPDPKWIKLLNGILFLINGGLIFRFVVGIQNLENKNGNKRNIFFTNTTAFFTASAASIFAPGYLQMVFSGWYEVITFTLILIILNVIINKNTPPLFFGMLCGVLYLSKPNLSLFVLVFTAYFLISKFPARKWIISGLLCVSGFLIVISPFIIRSIYYSGEPFFSLQQKIDIIKEVVLSHDELFKTFLPPPSIIEIILNNRDMFFLRWQTRVISAFSNMFRIDYGIAWIGLVLFLINFKKARWLAFCYLIFLAIHVIIVANYLVVSDTERVYSALLNVLVVLGFLGIIGTIKLLVTRITKEKIQNLVIITAILIVLLISIQTNFINRHAYVPPRKSIPQAVIEKIRQINPPCMYSNSPYHAAWDVDIPTFYQTADNNEMLTLGPQECRYFLYRDNNSEGTEKFLSVHGQLVFQDGLYEFYRLD